ncbi:MAG TPA: alpha/beta fold hydrolase [Jatrophihabitantaceae bacterium]|jgi:pimeloyl-ACP methyl ester carboxylesterase
MNAVARTVTLHGSELCYLDSGDGPALLFIHGLLGSRRSWRHLVTRLEVDHRVLAPDLFGHGASAKPVGDYSLGAHAATLRDLLDHAAVEKVTLIGHSLGGGIAMQFYYLFPERVERLVLVSSGGLGRELSPLLRSASLPGAEWVLPLLASGWVHNSVEAVAGVLRGAGWTPSPMLAESWYGFATLRDADARRAFLSTVRGVIDPGGQAVLANEYLPTVKHVPTLVVWGARDRIIPSSHGVAAHQAIAGSRLEIFEQAGHFPHLDQPERFAGVLTSFVADASELAPR